MDASDLSVEVAVTPRLRLATMRLARLLRQHDGAALSQSLLSALATVHRCGPMTLGRLAELERVQPPSMTRIVGHLEEKGLMARVPDETDRRVARVSVTPAGAAYLEEIRSQAIQPAQEASQRQALSAMASPEISDASPGTR